MVQFFSFAACNRRRCADRTFKRIEILKRMRFLFLRDEIVPCYHIQSLFCSPAYVGNITQNLQPTLVHAYRDDTSNGDRIRQLGHRSVS